MADDARARAVGESDLWRILDTLPLSIYVKDLECRFTYVNKTGADALGLRDPAEAIGADDRKFFRADIADAWIREERELFRTGRPVIVDRELEYRQDDRQAWVWTAKLPLVDGSGRVTGLLGISKDITQAAQELDRYRLAVEGARDGLWHRVIGSEDMWLSARWKAILGYEDDELLNRLDTFTSRLHPDDIDHVFKQRDRHFNGETPFYDCNYRLRHRDGTYRWIRARGKTVHGRIPDTREFAGSHTDITDTTDKEKFYLTVLDALPALVFVKDPEHRFVFVNSALASMFDLSKEELLGKTDKEVNPNADEVDQFWRADSIVLELEEPVKIAEEFLTDRKTKERRLLATAKWPHRLETGGAVHVLGVAVDITELRAAKDAFKHERDLLEGLMDNIPDGIFFKDRDLHFTRVNRALAQYAGVSGPKELEGKTDEEVFDKEFAAQGRESDLEVLASGKPVQQVMRLKTEAGPSWRLVSKAPILDSIGDVMQIVGVSKDITELERTRQDLHNTLTVLTDALVSIESSKNEEEACVQAMTHIEALGYESAMISFKRTVDGQSFIEADPVYATGKWKTIAPFTKRAAAGAPLDVLPAVLDRKKARFVRDSRVDDECDRDLCTKAGLVSQYVVPLVTSSLAIGTLQIDLGNEELKPESRCRMFDALAAHLSIAVERHRRLAELESINLDLLSEAKLMAFNSAATRVVHDLNHSIFDYLIKLKRAEESSELRSNRTALRFVRTTKAAVGAWYQALRDELSSLQTEHEYTVHLLDDVVRQTVGLWQHRADARGCKLTFEVIDSDLKVKARLGELREMLSCMIINSIEANARRVVVEVRVCTDRRVEETSRPFAEIRIVDNGDGIPIAFRDSITKFGWTSKGRRGHGVGLRIVDILVRAMGGRFVIRAGGKSANEGDTELALVLPTA